MSTQATNAAPVLLVHDVSLCARYWKDKLGFKAELFGDPPGFAILQRDGAVVMLSLAPQDAEIKPNWKVAEKAWDAFIWVNDAKAIYQEFIERGATIDWTLYEAPWGGLEFGIQDAQGYDIAFGQVID